MDDRWNGDGDKLAEDAEADVLLGDDSLMLRLEQIRQCFQQVRYSLGNETLRGALTLLQECYDHRVDATVPDKVLVGSSVPLARAVRQHERRLVAALQALRNGDLAATDFAMSDYS